MIASDAAVLGVGFALVIAGIGCAAWILRHEIRYQARQRRHGGFIYGGDR